MYVDSIYRPPVYNPWYQYVPEYVPLPHTPTPYYPRPSPCPGCGRCPVCGYSPAPQHAPPFIWSTLTDQTSDASTVEF